ncbi:MAG: hypothetical protein HZB79_03605 [Deltaproteobacteria bacterium]|nr:hypothetical protein [Deltaproteobacteria bacterium]
MEKLPVRKNIRLRHYNYSQDGYYFVTICCSNFQPNLARHKETAEGILCSLPKRFSDLKIDYYILMPDHIHIIFVFENAGVGFIQNCRGGIYDTRNNGLDKSSPYKKPVSLGEVVRTYKALVTKETKVKNFWQRNYYEHVIRSEDALSKIREYIQNNPDALKIRFEEFYKLADRA